MSETPNCKKNLGPTWIKNMVEVVTLIMSVKNFIMMSIERYSRTKNSWTLWWVSTRVTKWLLSSKSPCMVPEEMYWLPVLFRMMHLRGQEQIIAFSRINMLENKWVMNLRLLCVTIEIQTKKTSCRQNPTPNTPQDYSKRLRAIRWVEQTWQKTSTTGGILMMNSSPPFQRGFLKNWVLSPRILRIKTG